MNSEKQHKETELLRQLSLGDSEGLHQLMKIFFPILSRFAEKLVHEKAIAKDIVQETFVKLWNSGHNFENFGALKKFLYITTRNACLNALRSKEREQRKHNQLSVITNDQEESVLTQIIQSEVLAEIYEVIEALPDKMKEIFLMHFEEGLKISEIARRLGLSSQTVHNQKYKAMQVLKKEFKSRNLIILFAAFIKL